MSQNPYEPTPPTDEGFLDRFKRMFKERPWAFGLIAVAAILYVLWSEHGAGGLDQRPHMNFGPAPSVQPQSMPQQDFAPGAPDGRTDDLSPVDLPIQNLPQETEVWCWAAVSQQIIAASRGMQSTPPQCALVAIANGASPQACCQTRDQRCVRTGSLQQIQDLIQRYGGRTSSYAAPTDAMTLYRTLKMGHAVIIGVNAGQGMGHVVVARGMSFQQTPQGLVPFVHVNDPMAHFTQPVPFNQIAAVWRQAIIVN